MKEILTLCFDKLIEFTALFLKAMKFNLLKAKISLFTLVIGAFTWNYFVHFKKSVDGTTEFNFSSPENPVPTTVFIIMTILVVYLVQVDVNQIRRKHQLIRDIMMNTGISEALKQEMIDHIKAD